jgi:DNA-directed RNA polymerase specialized sigma54-like protein
MADDFVDKLNKEGYFSTKINEAKEAYRKGNWAFAYDIYSDILNNYEKTAMDEEDQSLGIPGMTSP